MNLSTIQETALQKLFNSYRDRKLKLVLPYPVFPRAKDVLEWQQPYDHSGDENQ